MPKAFQKVYTKLVQITKATVALRAENVGNDEMALVDGRPAQVVKMIGDIVTLQVFQGTEGIPTNAEVVFLGRPPRLKVSELLAGRFFNAYGEPIGVPQGHVASDIHVHSLYIPRNFCHSPTASSSQRLLLGLSAWPLTQWQRT